MNLAAGTAPVFDPRRAGVLLHPTSLPSGMLDGDADRFIDWLVAAGFSAWQMLPVGPAGAHGSPYSSASAFAGNTRLLPENVRAAPVDTAGFARFAERESHWLDDYGLFVAIREQQDGIPWWEWSAGLRHREPRALQRFANDHREAVDACRHGQYRFARHWARFRESAAASGVSLIGDLPMFVVADSADAWARPELFRIDADGRCDAVAGVPPDHFSATGQCWDNPVYDWDAMAGAGFDWWVRRLRVSLDRFDVVRWDHFRGLSATWEIPVGADGMPAPAVEGEWRDVPGRALLQRLREAFGPLPVIAENLGIITPEVESLRRDFALPGLHVLQFAFDGSPDNPHLPDQHEELGVACTGTHDNDTALGWWRSLEGEVRDAVRDVLGARGAAASPADLPMPDALVEAALQSRCRLAMIPLQDLLRLGSEARMNRPGEPEGQWRWRFDWNDLTAGLAADWRRRVEPSGRA